MSKPTTKEKAAALALRLNEIDRDKISVSLSQVVRTGTKEEIDFFYAKLCEGK